MSQKFPFATGPKKDGKGGLGLVDRSQVDSLGANLCCEYYGTLRSLSTLKRIQLREPHQSLGAGGGKQARKLFRFGRCILMSQLGLLRGNRKRRV